MQNNSKKTAPLLDNTLPLFELQLADAGNNFAINQVQLLRVGEFRHPHAPNGKFQITKETLARLKVNFDENVRRLGTHELAVDYSHESGKKAAGWINGVELRESGNELWINVEWTEEASIAIMAKEWRMISADLDFNYTDNENLINHGPTLLGAGLTNRPHIKSMQAILSEKKTKLQESTMPDKIEELALLVAKLEAKVNALESRAQAAEGDLEQKEGELSEANKRNVTLQEQVTKLEGEKITTAKEVRFNEMLTEGKVMPSQKESFMELELTLAEKLFANAKVINLEEQGHAGEGENKGGEKKAAKKKDVQDEVDELAVKLCEGDKSLQYIEAVSLVLSENASLNERYNNFVNSAPYSAGSDAY